MKNQAKQDLKLYYHFANSAIILPRLYMGLIKVKKQVNYYLTSPLTL